MNILDSVTIFTKSECRQYSNLTCLPNLILIFSPFTVIQYLSAGVIAYHYDFHDRFKDELGNILNNVSLSANPHHMSQQSIQRVNSFISSVLLDPLTSSILKSSKRCILPIRSSSKDSVSIVVEWLESPKNGSYKISSSLEPPRDDLILLVMYPNLVLSSSLSASHLMEGSTSSSSNNVRALIPWIPRFLQLLLREYTLFYNHVSPARSVPMKQTLFDGTLMILLKQAQGDVDTSGSHDNSFFEESTKTNPRNDTTNIHTQRSQERETKVKKGKKEGTVWHDNLQKVTKETMAALDRSKDSNPNLSGIDAVAADDSRALAEARAVYLPSDGETPLWEETDELEDTTTNESTVQNSKSWGMALKGLFDQVSGNKILTPQDLEFSLEEMQKLLTSKNVSSEIATTICQTVKAQLVGKRMASFSRVKTAVRVALEDAIEKILKPTRSRDVDVLRAVVSKREQQRNSFFQTQKQDKRPYVIVMIGMLSYSLLQIYSRYSTSPES